VRDVRLHGGHAHVQPGGDLGVGLAPGDAASRGFRSRWRATANGGSCGGSRPTPAGPLRVIGAQLIVSLIVVLAATIGVLAVGRLGFGVRLPGQLAGFALVVVLSATAMLALGLLIGALAPTARSAGAAGTVLFFPLMYFAGLWTPQLSAAARRIGQFTPLGAADHALRDAMAGAWPHPAALLVLGGCTIACAAAAARFFRWD
jgi:ABC-2 type transport system permease protein